MLFYIKFYIENVFHINFVLFNFSIQLILNELLNIIILSITIGRLGGEMKKQLLSIALSLTLIVQTFPALGSTTIQGNNTFNAISTNLTNETEYKVE